MILPLIAFVIILAAIIFIKWRQKLSKPSELPGAPEAKSKEKKEEPSSKVAEIIKISAAGAIFLILLWILAPEFITRHHKEIAVMVVAMIVGASLLGISQKWEESSTRKILRAHYIALTIILVLAVFYKDPETSKWLESFKPSVQPQAATVECLDSQDIVARNRSEIIVRPNCWSGNISIPAQYWFRIVPEGRVTIRTWSGRVIHDAPGQANWLGDEIRDGNFRIISDESQPVKVVIIFRPK